ncbi:hypothetical protein JXA85_06575 [Candidatus Woesearchaeota archaeon]|nr:hypothetical protein [Candidatus Woesearchaeota archaeon]
MSVRHDPEDIPKDDSIYTVEALLDLLENDEITSEEEGFIIGYIQET